MRTNRITNGAERAIIENMLDRNRESPLVESVIVNVLRVNLAGDAPRGVAAKVAPIRYVDDLVLIRTVAIPS